MTRFRHLLLGSLLAFASSGSLFALPGGGKVAHGSASIDRSGNKLTIRQNTGNLILNWKSFSIKNGETTRFIQPTSESAALNRVIGGSRSMLDGTLKANGKVILINPNGITVGPSGVVDVKSFTASTQNLTNAEFIGGGELLYKGDSDASIENLGVIRASGGDAILIAREIRNSGKITASGLVGLAAGSEVLIRPVGEERIFIQSDTRKAGKITQTGAIVAATAEIRATGNPYATAINLDGFILVNPGNKTLIVKSDPGLIKGAKTLEVATFVGDYSSAGYLEAGVFVQGISWSIPDTIGTSLVELDVFGGYLSPGDAFVSSGVLEVSQSYSLNASLNFTLGEGSTLLNSSLEDSYLTIGGINYQFAPGGSVTFRGGVLNLHNATLFP